MPIPDYQTFMLPLLKFAGDRKEHTNREAIEKLSDEFKLTIEERTELIPSGRTPRVDDRISWAATYLRKAQLLSSPARGRFQITQRGLDVLKQAPSKINVHFLEQFNEFVEFRTRREKENIQTPKIGDEQTPDEVIDAAYQTLRQNLATEIIESILNCSSAFFERLVVDVLVKMGYGGTRQDAGRAIGKSGDEGIDGIINEDRLGLDVIYIQAKKWDKDKSISRPEIQKFAGALQGQRAKKGIFITTSNFTKEAQEFASRIDSKIILINGVTLAQLMIDYNVGVNLVAAYELKRIDSDYFGE
jgi:restriction system protein